MFSEATKAAIRNADQVNAVLIEGNWLIRWRHRDRAGFVHAEDGFDGVALYLSWADAQSAIDEIRRIPRPVTILVDDGEVTGIHEGDIPAVGDTITITTDDGEVTGRVLDVLRDDGWWAPPWAIRYTVAIEDGTTGEVIDGAPMVGETVTVRLNDENGNPITRTGTVNEILYTRHTGE